MTHSASEVFTMQLARAAGKTANKFLRSRGLQQADRDDVIAAAMLWCWENRDNYSLTTTLDTWFMNAIRDAYKNMRRQATPSADVSLEAFSGDDPTFAAVAAEEAAQVLVDALPQTYKEVAALTMKGHSRREMMTLGYSKQSIDDTHKRVKQLRRLVPDSFESLLAERSRTKVVPMSDNIDSSKNFSAIDRQLHAALDLAPKHDAKDCPVCWRCMWFEGYMPGNQLSIRMEITDKEVREAVRVTEARKIEIAQQVRDGV